MNNLKNIYGLIIKNWVLQHDKRKMACLWMQEHWQKMALRVCMHAHVYVPKPCFHSPVSSQSGLSSLLPGVHRCLSRHPEETKARESLTQIHPHPKRRDRQIERCSRSLRSTAGLISPLYPLFAPSGAMRLRADVSVISVHLLVREGSSSLMHYSRKQHQPRQVLSRQGEATITPGSVAE